MLCSILLKDIYSGAYVIDNLNTFRYTAVLMLYRQTKYIYNGASVIGKLNIHLQRCLYYGQTPGLDLG